MALVSLRQLLDHAAEHDYGVPANINNLEQIHANMEADLKTDPTGNAGGRVSCGMIA